MGDVNLGTGYNKSFSRSVHVSGRVTLEHDRSSLNMSFHIRANPVSHHNTLSERMIHLPLKDAEMLRLAI